MHTVPNLHFLFKNSTLRKLEFDFLNPIRQKILNLKWQKIKNFEFSRQKLVKIEVQMWAKI